MMLFRVQPHGFWQQTAWFREPEVLFTSLCLAAFSELSFQRCAFNPFFILASATSHGRKFQFCSVLHKEEPLLLSVA